MQKTLAKKYNFDPTIVKSIADFEPFLEQIKKGEKGLYPVITGSYPVFPVTCELVGDFAYFDRNDSKIIVKPYLTSDILKAEQNHESEWLAKGYLRKDSLTVTDDSADVKANKYAVTFGTMKPGLDAELKASRGIEWVSGSYDKPYVGAASGTETMTAMNVNCKNPEEAMKVLYEVNSDKEIYNKLVFGIKGTHYDMVDNTVQAKKDSKYKMNGSAWALGNQFNALYQVGQVQGTWEETDKINKSAQVSYLRGFTFNAEPVQAEIAQLNAVKKEYDAFFRFGTKGRDAKRKEFESKLNAAGNEKVVAEIQKQIDAWKKTKSK